MVTVPAARDPEQDAALVVEHVDQQQVFAVEFDRSRIQDEVARLLRQVPDSQNRIFLVALKRFLVHGKCFLWLVNCFVRYYIV